LGTSSNYSVRLNLQPLDLLITASGKDKGRLGRRDFVRVGSDGQPLWRDQPVPSAETWLHIVLYEDLEIGAVLHTHSSWGTILSDRHFSDGQLVLDGFEMLKGLRGVNSHQHRERIAIFENTQDIPQLAREVRDRRAANDPALDHAFLIRRHGLYTWGRDLDEAVRHIEVLEFLFECLGCSV
jgi:methylthioribulose-1-phosphate dehydratase